jgi:hypothetical protein
MAHRPQAEEVIKLGDGQGRDGELTLARGEIGQRIKQFTLLQTVFETKRSHNGGMKTIARRSSGQPDDGIRIQTTKGWLGT